MYVHTCKDNSKQEAWLGSSIRLFVKCAPRPLQKVTSPMYVPVTLSFTTLAYPEPGPKGFLWYKENGTDWIPLLSNSDVQISSSGLQSNITIFNVSLSDYGTYRLTVTNEVGINKQMIRLVKKDSTQKELRESGTEGDAYSSWMIVGIVWVFLTIAIGFYATV
ncbi:uncharacterized protein LOC132745450 [Ruditapes philippinarum]|uniref:uncharacterized protein LOC132745450 n=1 Tax=Ruditapes philippinarum TaxID=129788 RepID=UPI00295C0188|nr:uncharacterized protein LOC132745450 [Ruditapes philippinarum]